MKTIIIGLAMLLSLTANATPTHINPNIIKLFKQSFPLAKNVTWYNGTMKYEDKSDDGFSSSDENFIYSEACFLENDMSCRVYYNQDGKVFSCERYYSDEEKLSPFIVEKVKNEFSGKTFKGITEIQNDKGLSYQIILEDYNSLYFLACHANGEIHLCKKIRKA